MWYSVVRLGCFVVIFFVLCGLFLPLIRKKKWMVMLPGVAACFLAILVAFVPFENLFVTFSTPQQAFAYQGQGELEVVLEGEGSALLISSLNENTITQEILLRHSDGWKLGTGKSLQSCAKVSEGDVTADLLQEQKSGDYYLQVEVSGQKEAVITDSLGSQFDSILKGSAQYDNWRLVAYAPLRELDESYFFTVGEQTLTFDDLPLTE